MAFTWSKLIKGRQVWLADSPVRNDEPHNNVRLAYYPQGQKFYVYTERDGWLETQEPSDRFLKIVRDECRREFSMPQLPISTNSVKKEESSLERLKKISFATLTLFTMFFVAAPFGMWIENVMGNASGVIACIFAMLFTFLFYAIYVIKKFI